MLDTTITTTAEPPPLDVATLWRAIESAAEQAGIGVYVAHIDVQPPRILYVNGRAADIVGQARGDLIGRLPWSMLREQDRPTVRALVERPAGAPPASVELMVERPDGKTVPIELAATRTRATIGELSFGYFRDVSIEHDVIAALRRSEARFRPSDESRAAPVPAPVASAARRRVLVVDDEVLICNAIEQVLIDSHDVAVATTADDALALVASRPFDIIFCDVMMPGINGHELYRRVAAQRPGLERRFVFMTGALAPSVASALEGLPNPSLAKPFEIEDVLALIAASDAA